MRLQDAGFTISKRSIERDLNELSLIFPLDRNDKSIPYGWHWSATVAANRSRPQEILGSIVEGLHTLDLHSCLRSAASADGQQNRIELVAWVSDTLARRLRETPLAADMRLTALERGHQLTVSISNNCQLLWWLLSQGDGLIVEQPPALRQQIADMLHSAAAQYRKD